jgi:16S rRNA (guanine527-N7)-methyltransferase
MNEILLFKKICDENSLSLSDEELELIGKYHHETLSWNKKINLISRRDEVNILNKHILGSISFLFQLRFEGNSSVCDFGTGGGFPGIPIAIVSPDLQLTLIDSIQKKVTAVSQIVQSLRLPNVKVLCGRGEELGATKAFNHKFDYVIARAVASISDLVKWCKPLLKLDVQSGNDEDSFIKGKLIIPRGSLVLLKGGDLKDEIQEAQNKAKLRSIQIHNIEIKGNENIDFINKKLVIIQP